MDTTIRVRFLAAVVSLLVACSSPKPTGATSIVMDYRENPAIERTELVYFNGDVRLAATLMRPVAGKAKATAILIQGSGKSSRMNVWAGMIAQLFVANDIAVVFPDKRGSGDSGGDLATSSMQDFADDAIAAARHLRSHPELGAPTDKIGVIGLSQGGRVAPLAAARFPDEIAFVVALSAGATPGYVAIQQERENTYRELAIELDWLVQFRACDAVADRLILSQIEFAQYMPCTTQFIDSPYANFAQRIYPSDPNDWRFSFFGKMLRFDPLPYWLDVDQPSFIALGADDELENVPVARSVWLLENLIADNAKKNLSIHVYPDVGHALWRQQEQQYIFDESFAQQLADWLRTDL